MTKTIDITSVVDRLLEIRGNIYLLIDDARQNKANGKHFAYKKCYFILSSTIHSLNNELEETDKRKI